MRLCTLLFIAHTWRVHVLTQKNKKEVVSRHVSPDVNTHSLSSKGGGGISIILKELKQ